MIVERLTSPEDIDGILAVEDASFTNPWTRGMYLGELENQGVAFLFGVRDAAGRIVAFCSCWHVADEFHINNLAVLPEWRRRGIASAMLSHVIAEAETRRASQLLLEVRHSNHAARELYRRFGFTIFATRRQYYSQPPEDALVLRRVIASHA
jgi:ribosomal-protein-alanine N-acetyltransferase